MRVGLGISAVYFVIGVSFAAAGLLSPIFCAVLMPLSSASVVSFACVTTGLAARGLGLASRRPVLQESQGVPASLQPVF